MDSVYNGYSVLCIYCLELELHQGLCLCLFLLQHQILFLSLIPCEDNSWKLSFPLAVWDTNTSCQCNHINSETFASLVK